MESKLIQTRIERIVYAVTSRNWRVSNEGELQHWVDVVLGQETAPQCTWTREHVFTPTERIDHWSTWSIGVECKVDGSLPSVLRQLQRYAEQPAMKGLVLITTRRRLVINKRTIGGKPFACCYIGAGLG